MDKLPTDNLYKFLALSGMALAIYCSYTSIQLFNQRESRVFEFNVKEDDRTQKMVAADVPWTPPVWMTEPPEMPIARYDTDDSKERERWIDGVDTLIGYYTLNRELPTKEIMDAYLAEPKTKAAVGRHEGLSSGSERDAYVKGMTFEKFIALTEPNRVHATLHQGLLLQHKKELQQLWDYIDSNRFQTNLYGGGIGWGALLAVVGFVLWYWKAQRFEDAIIYEKGILALETKAAKKAAAKLAKSKP